MATLRSAVQVATVLAALALASACSSSGSSAGKSTGKSAGSATQPTGSEVKIMIIATKDNPGLKQSNAFEAAQARVDAVNASGGLSGHKLTLIQCDENLDPNQEKACVKKAVSQKVSAVVGSSLLFDQFDSLESAHIPLLYNIGLTPKLYQSPISWPTGGIVSWFAGEAMMASKLDLKTVALGGVNQAASQAGMGIVKLAAANLKLQVVGTVTSSITATDLTSDAAALTRSNPDGVLLSGTNLYNTQMIKALVQGGYKGKLLSQAPGLKPADIQALGSAANGVYLSAVGQPTDSATSTEAKQMQADVAKYGSAAKDLGDETSAASWSGVYLFASVMAHATSFTGQDVIAALTKLSSPIPGGVFGPFVGSGDAPFTAYPRLFNASYLPEVIKDGKVVATGDFVTIPPPVLKAAS
jgi:ABC-type branched-subunit amino acid transport system substrate-binding protein